MFHKIMEEWLKGEQCKILFPTYKKEDVFMLEEFVNYLDSVTRQSAEQSVQQTAESVEYYCECPKCHTQGAVELWSRRR